MMGDFSSNYSAKPGTIEYHRKPTMGEIRFGHGAIHYADFPIEQTWLY
jgi:hypothetical protein